MDHQVAVPLGKDDVVGCGPLHEASVGVCRFVMVHVRRSAHEEDFGRGERSLTVDLSLFVDDAGKAEEVARAMTQAARLLREEGEKEEGRRGMTNHERWHKFASEYLD